VRAVHTAISVGGAASGRVRQEWDDAVSLVKAADRWGVDFVWSAEAWGQDAVVPLAYLAAVTERIKLATGIMQVSARAPVMTAMTALTLATVSGDRFVLGLGVSGPQVVEGLHGVAFDHPLARLREHLAIVRLAFAGEKLVYDGREYVLPRPGGQGKALRLSQPPNPNIPVYLATLSPHALELTGREADGWVGTSFTPEGADATIGVITAAAQAAARAKPLDLQAGGRFAFGAVEQLIAERRPELAFQLGAMGSGTTNFYNDAYRRGGWEEAGEKVRALWKAGRRDEAIAAVPDELVLRTSFLGDDETVSARIRAYRDAGVTTLRIDPAGANADERLATLERALDLVGRVGPG
jgi:F420-dependent oxidoreductase-like protein